MSDGLGSLGYPPKFPMIEFSIAPIATHDSSVDIAPTMITTAMKPTPNRNPSPTVSRWFEPLTVVGWLPSSNGSSVRYEYPHMWQNVPFGCRIARQLGQ